MKALGLFLQMTALILLPSVLIWSVMGKVSSRVELSMLAVSAALFYAGALCSRRDSG